MLFSLRLHSDEIKFPFDFGDVSLYAVGWKINKYSPQMRMPLPRFQVVIKFSNIFAKFLINYIEQY